MALKALCFITVSAVLANTVQANLHVFTYIWRIGAGYINVIQSNGQQGLFQSAPYAAGGI